MRMALAQINPVIGDFAGNAQKICDHIHKARAAKSDLVIFPEMALLGYPPRDLLDRKSFVENSKRFWPRIQEASGGIGVICGVVTDNQQSFGKPYHNSAFFFHDGSLLATFHKKLLPSYDVFDEERYFEPGSSVSWIDFKGERLGITICEDFWNVPEFLPRTLYHCDPLCPLEQASIGTLINISASPYHLGKVEWVSQLLRRHAKRFKSDVVYVNQVGGNDELLFRGHSMVCDEKGKLVACGADFREDLIFYDSGGVKGDINGGPMDPAEEVLQALVMGLKDYAAKCGFKSAVIGLSGGIDSALVASIARLALGSENLVGVGMPGPYNAPESLQDSIQLAQSLGIRFHEVPIERLFSMACDSLSPVFSGLPHDATEENIQARLRGLILMAFSNKFGSLLLSTGNKSEMAVGYCTLYGDMNGGLAVLGDVPKTLAYRMAEKINERYGWIPQRTITRPPSAELKPNQTDQDTLPPYEVLDGILAAYVEQGMSTQEIIAQGWEPQTVRWVVDCVDNNEYKRWQAPPILRVTTKAFGTGRRNPIAHRYREGRMI